MQASLLRGCRQVLQHLQLSSQRALPACGQLLDRAWLSTQAEASHSDFIHINGMRFHGRHGVLEEETRLGQVFVADARLTVDATKAGETDDLQHTVNYASVYSDVKAVVEGPPCKLLEAVAHRAAAAVLQRHPGVHAVNLKLRKLSIPGVPSFVDSVGVEVNRRRQ